MSSQITSNFSNPPSQHEIVLMRDYLGVHVEITEDQLKKIKDEQTEKNEPFALTSIVTHEDDYSESP